MADWNDTQRSQQQSFTGASVPRTGEVYDEGLRKYMLGVYNYMASAILLTGIVSILTAETGLVFAMFNLETGSPSLFGWAMMAGPFILVMWLQFRIFKMSVLSAQIAYWVYATAVGISIATIFIAYTPISIAQTFFATAAAFAGLSLYGYTTKKDMSGWGTFLIMGIWGLFAAMLLNVFVFQSPLMDMVMSGVGVLLFAAFTAYKTQEVKNIYSQVRGNTEMMAKTTIYGALHLYMAFINMFLFLLRFMGSRE
ncbi:Bax inhibitor-1/YccA family protein [Pontixanthobacter sp. CEM42]|uniref:Bax inhibitor-1/YccA family protein n=1 Tax=Pontixanthobacter sp. CEM42 TaxID=2792077 RepID=UPI001ADF51DA|nr:Bax inhibitor-1/YccA family protein [Pontixanthobacter sp. CEM42]